MILDCIETACLYECMYVCVCICSSMSLLLSLVCVCVCVHCRCVMCVEDVHPLGERFLRLTFEECALL